MDCKNKQCVKVKDVNNINEWRIKMKKHTMIELYINKKIREGKKNIVFKLYKLTDKKRKLCKDVIEFLDENNLRYATIIDTELETTIIIKLDGRSTYVKKVKQSLKKEGK